jgi:hypothetical protein
MTRAFSLAKLVVGHLRVAQSSDPAQMAGADGAARATQQTTNNIRGLFLCDFA